MLGILFELTLCITNFIPLKLYEKLNFESSLSILNYRIIEKVVWILFLNARILLHHF